MRIRINIIEETHKCSALFVHGMGIIDRSEGIGELPLVPMTHLINTLIRTRLINADTPH